jgi:hypothetical protein
MERKFEAIYLIRLIFCFIVKDNPAVRTSLVPLPVLEGSVNCDIAICALVPFESLQHICLNENKATLSRYNRQISVFFINVFFDIAYAL